jgi:anti-sigma regulatory factor (Ser/Thr protein kinase)
MKELSLNILDVTENSVRAGARNIGISLICDKDGILTLTIEDDGCGMNEETLKRVSDPFYTTRKTRKIGLGIPFLRLAALQANGEVRIKSTPGEGTTVKATFDTNSIDFTPIGDMVSTMTTLIMGAPNVDFTYEHVSPNGKVFLDTKELRAVLGGVSLASVEVIGWIKDYLREQYNNFGGNKL